MREHLMKVVPMGFLAGIAMELFMINTGFYRIVGQKEAERRYERAQEESALQERMKRLNIKFDDLDEKK